MQRECLLLWVVRGAISFQDSVIAMQTSPLTEFQFFYVLFPLSVEMNE